MRINKKKLDNYFGELGLKKDWIAKHIGFEEIAARPASFGQKKRGWLIENYKNPDDWVYCPKELVFLPKAIFSDIEEKLDKILEE